MQAVSTESFNRPSLNASSALTRHVHRWGFLVVLVLILTSGIAVNLWQRTGDARLSRATLENFPAQIGGWQRFGADQRFDRATEEVLRADDYLSRNYAKPFASGALVASLYVGYYNTQRTGATYHSPLNCLPGSGWILTEQERTLVTPADGAPPFLVNRYTIANGRDRQIMLYWYSGRGRNTASEYQDKINTVLDSMTRRRSDGAMVRLLVPISPTGDRAEAEALAFAQDFAAHVTPHLAPFVPK
ncbi:MAG: EpsI family protein [Pyrinomonadaceae bacterium MAG19_C2-C3]|nr:EpsI family protein [Pyrinomonadaceae bacterium MAG19_C2-C3]